MDKKNENEGIHRYSIQELAALDEAGVARYLDRVKKRYEEDGEQFTDLDKKIALARIDEAKRLVDDHVTNYEIVPENYARFQVMTELATQVAEEQDGYIEPFLLDPRQSLNGQIVMRCELFMGDVETIPGLCNLLVACDGCGIRGATTSPSTVFEFQVNDIFKRIK